MKRNIPRLVVVLSLCLFAHLASAQETSNLNSKDKATLVTSELKLPELVRRVKPSVVSVLTYDVKGEPLISGSGLKLATYPYFDAATGGVQLSCRPWTITPGIPRSFAAPSRSWPSSIQPWFAM